MSDDRISSNEAIEAALHLDGDPQNVKQFYADWARTYDQDTSDSQYSGPTVAASLLDAGCGTGQVGIALQALGYTHIDGFDLSPEMAELASSTGAYARVAGNIDMMRALEDYPNGEYDAVLSIGVFTLGHVPPRALTVLLQLLGNEGLLVISTRSQYFEQTDFQQCVDTLLQAGQISLLQVIRDAPYNHDGDAHYWVFRKLTV